MTDLNEYNYLSLANYIAKDMIKKNINGHDIDIFTILDIIEEFKKNDDMKGKIKKEYDTEDEKIFSQIDVIFEKNLELNREFVLKELLI